MGRQITVDTVLTYHNLHTVPKQAAVGLLVVCGCVCVEARRSGEQSNHTQINLAVVRRSRRQFWGGGVHVLDGEKDTVFTYRR